MENEKSSINKMLISMRFHTSDALRKAASGSSVLACIESKSSLHDHY